MSILPSKRIPLNAISSANRHVAEILKDTKWPRGKYNCSTPELQAEIGKVKSEFKQQLFILGKCLVSMSMKVQ